MGLIYIKNIPNGSIPDLKKWNDILTSHLRKSFTHTVHVQSDFQTILLIFKFYNAFLSTVVDFLFLFLWFSHVMSKYVFILVLHVFKKNAENLPVFIFAITTNTFGNLYKYCENVDKHNYNLDKYIW